MMASHFPQESPIGLTIEQAVMAPALTSGVDGWSFSRSIAKIELKGSPVASAPICLSTASAPYCFKTRIAVSTLETDSTPN